MKIIIAEGKLTVKIAELIKAGNFLLKIVQGLGQLNFISAQNTGVALI